MYDLCIANFVHSSHFIFIFSFFLWPLIPQEAHAMQEKVSAQYKNEIDMAKAQRDYELKKAAYDVEVNTKKAESEMAYQLQVYTLELQLGNVTVLPVK